MTQERLRTGVSFLIREQVSLQARRRNEIRERHARRVCKALDNM